MKIQYSCMTTKAGMHLSDLVKCFMATLTKTEKLHDDLSVIMISLSKLYF